MDEQINDLGLEIPHEIAEKIQTAVKVDKSNHINCHKFVLFILNKISYEELISNPQDGDFTFGIKASKISDKEFVDIKNVDELKVFANKGCKDGKLYIGQILDAVTGEMAHSFLVGKAKGSEEFICFDKQGFKFPFGTYKIEKLFEFENYHNQKWRFIGLDEVS